MSIENLDCNSADELLHLVRQINEQYYERFNENVFYLEEVTDAVYIVYFVELRDAYSHLARMAYCDLPSQKEEVRIQLIKYKSHLQNGLLDSFRRILTFELRMLKGRIPRKNRKEVEYQIAVRASKLRIMGKDTSIEQRIEGYELLLKHISELKNGYVPGAK